MRRALLGLVLAATTAGAAELPAGIARILDGHGIQASDLSLVVHEVGADEPLLSHLPDSPRNPASVMKVVTTWSALELLGPAYQWPTAVYLLGELDDGRLDGDLALKGFGDPFLVVEEYWGLLRALRRYGLEHVDGDLVIDDSYFSVSDGDPGAFDGQPFRTYNVVPNALLVNFKAARFEFFPERNGRDVRIAVDPPLDNLKIENRLELGDGPCRGYQRGIAFTPNGTERADRVVFDGRYPARCGSYSLTRTVLEHDTYAYGLFAALWRELGGRFDGGLRKVVIPEDMQPVMLWHSPPLADVIRSINKNSNNVMTRQVLYTLGAETAGPPGTLAGGEKAVADFLESQGLDTSALVLDNGAGLSRTATVTADMLADLLLAAASSLYRHEFIGSLSLGGLDGTTRGRFTRLAEQGLMHVKTGRIDDVSALAGYVTAPGGGTRVIVSLLNTPEAHRGPGQELEEALIDWVRTLD